MTCCSSLRNTFPAHLGIVKFNVNLSLKDLDDIQCDWAPVSRVNR